MKDVSHSLVLILYQFCNITNRNFIIFAHKFNQFLILKLNTCLDKRFYFVFLARLLYLCDNSKHKRCWKDILSRAFVIILVQKIAKFKEQLKDNKQGAHVSVIYIPVRVNYMLIPNFCSIYLILYHVIFVILTEVYALKSF